MKTQNIIQSSANVVRLVNLKKGDVFKSVKSDNYSDGINYNIVTNLYNDGENTFIEVVQYEKSYSSVSAKMKVFNGANDISIFPAEVEEVEEYFANALKSIEEDIEKKKKELASQIQSFEKAKEFTSGELSKQIQSAEFKEQTTEEYQNEKALKEAKLKELTD